ncbi:MAG TPA: hypothetical protein VNZ23_09395 [Xanthobacteraceae bacterium]|nr:hypothetical protein [Xanthobacteraceae bacterium]
MAKGAAFECVAFGAIDQRCRTRLREDFIPLDHTRFRPDNPADRILGAWLPSFATMTLPDKAAAWAGRWNAAEEPWRIRSRTTINFARAPLPFSDFAVGNATAFAIVS